MFFVCCVLGMMFCLIFDLLLVDFWIEHRSKIYKKSINKSSKQHNNKKSKKCQKCNTYGTFGTSAMLRCIQKSIKNRCNIRQKRLSNQHPNLASILEPTWLYFDGLLEAKMGTSWHQIAPKIDLQIDHKNDHLSDRSWARF